MTRLYGQIYCSIWDDPEFCALGAGAQRTYFMLTTQDNISACGALPLTLRRWSKKCRNVELGDWLDELTEAGFVLIDEDTEELLVRTFAKHDGGYRHAVRRKAVIATARAIKSPRLRSTAGDELGKLGVSTATTVPLDRDTSGTGEVSESQRFLVTLGDHSPEPESGILERGTQPASGPPSMFCSKHPNGTEEPCRGCATARTGYAAWVQATVGAEAEARAAATAAIAGCDACDEKGIRTDRDTRKPLGRCDHTPPLALVAAVGRVQDKAATG